MVSKSFGRPSRHSGFGPNLKKVFFAVIDVKTTVLL